MRYLFDPNNSVIAIHIFVLYLFKHLISFQLLIQSVQDGASSSSLRPYFLAMGFREEQVAKAIKENGELV